MVKRWLVVAQVSCWAGCAPVQTDVDAYCAAAATIAGQTACPEDECCPGFRCVNTGAGVEPKRCFKLSGDCIDRTATSTQLQEGVACACDGDCLSNKCQTTASGKACGPL